MSKKNLLQGVTKHAGYVHMSFNQDATYVLFIVVNKICLQGV